MLDQLSKRGLSASAAQLERWRADGLLPTAVRTPLGRGRGSTSEYPPGAIEVAVVLAKLGGQGVPLHRGVLGLFFAGLPVPEDRLREAIRSVVTSNFAAEFNLVPAVALGASSLTDEQDPTEPYRLSAQAIAAADNIAAHGVNEVGSDQVIAAVAELSVGATGIDTKNLYRRLVDRELKGEPLVPPLVADGAGAALAVAELPLSTLESLRSEALAVVSMRATRPDAVEELLATRPEVLLVAMVMWRVVRTTGGAGGG